MPVTTGRTVIWYSVNHHTYTYDIPNQGLSQDHLQQIEAAKDDLEKVNKATMVFAPGTGISELVVTLLPISSRGVEQQRRRAHRRICQIIRDNLGFGEVDILPAIVR